MAYHKPADLDSFLSQMGKADMRIRAQLAEDLVTFLSDSDNSIVCSDLGLLIDGLIPWLTGSHFKIAQRALEAYTELIVRLGPDFSAYTPSVLPHVVDRLGDSKDTVREKAQLLLHKLMESKVVSPQVLLDKLTTCFKHKNSKVREEYLQTIVNTLNEYGTGQLSLKAYIQPIVTLLSDPTANVRDAAIQTLVEIYKHVGDRLRGDLRKKEVPAMKMAILEQKFDEIRNDDLLLPSAKNSGGSAFIDEPDTATLTRPTRLVKRAPSATRKPLMSDPGTLGGGDIAAGAVTVEVFEASFEVVPQLTIFGPRDMEDQIKTINAIIGDKTMDWEKRVDALKKIRSLLILNIQSNPTFPSHLKDLSIAFLDILKELRSQVIREACITIAYMCKTLRNRLDTFCVYILQEMISLIQNSAKVIASSGTIALKYVIRYTHAPKLVPIITQNLMQSKSKDIRSSLSEILYLLLEEWATKSLERNAGLLRDAVKKGISDADMDARRHSRRSYWLFKRHFPDMAESMFMQMDPATQKAVEKERDLLNGTGSMSASLRGSNSSLNSMLGVVSKRRATSGLRSPASTTPAPMTSVSTENLSSSKLQRVPSLPRSYNRNRSGIPVVNRERSSGEISIPPRAGFRSVSAVDTAAAQRAKARAQYSNLARLKVTSGTASLQGYVAQQARVKRNIVSTPQSRPEPRVVNRTGRSHGVSQSQPTSRSTSPSSRLRDSNPYYSAYRQTGTVPKKTSGIPRSLANSRETSPTRSQLGSAYKRSPYAMETSSPRRPDRPPINPARPVRFLSQKLLQQSREAEIAMADALSPDDIDYSPDYRLPSRKISKDESDESEASSVCSERSMDSLRRGTDYSWNGSRNRLDSYRQPIEDIDLIISMCASTHWSERKDGLINLTQYLSDGKLLTPEQLPLVLDLFRKMFMDSHTKVYSLFLDTVNELILAHSNDLHDWLFILLTRLFNKLGAELLVSMYSKIWKTLQLVYEYFPPDLQVQSVFRILVDAAQTPNLKTKISTLKFLTNLATTYCTGVQFSAHSTAEKALIKISQYLNDQKSVELRSQARTCIVAMYGCNTPDMIMLMNRLPKSLQDTLKTVIQHNLRRSTSGNDSPSPLSCSSPKPLLSPQQGGPYSLQNNNSSPRSRQSSVEGTDPMNTEDVYRSLRRTTHEIQNYSFESKLDRDTNSKDSGISQMGDHVMHMEQYSYQTNGINGHLGLDKEDSCNGSKTQSTATTESNTPENTIRMDSMDSNNKTLTQHRQPNVTFMESGELVTEKGIPESEIIREAVQLTQDSNHERTVHVLGQLSICIKYGNCRLIIKDFKSIMKTLLHLMESPVTIVMIAALKTLSRILISEYMKQSWSNFRELILLKIIDCYKASKEVAREIDSIIPKIAAVLPVDESINILKPVIATGEYPANLCALKILLDLIDRHGRDLTEIHLDSIMPHIARLTEDGESMVRKAAVFCIVKLYLAMGEDKVKPKFALLNASKIRLINVYITKTQTNKGVSSS